MFITYMMVGIAFAILELTIVNNWPWLRKILERNPIIEMIFSIALGVVGGYLMGIPAGVTIAIGNIFATVITKAVYATHALDHWKTAKQWAVDNKDKITDVKLKLVKASKFWYKVFIFIPVTLPMWFVKHYRNIASAASAVKIKLKGFGGRAKRATSRA